MPCLEPHLERERIGGPRSTGYRTTQLAKARTFAVEQQKVQVTAEIVDDSGHDPKWVKPKLWIKDA
jgi:hypothetical protein